MGQVGRGPEVALVGPGGQPLRHKGHEDGPGHTGQESIAPGHEPARHHGLLPGWLTGQFRQPLQHHTGQEHGQRGPHERAAQGVDEQVGWQPPPQGSPNPQRQRGGHQPDPHPLHQHLVSRGLPHLPDHRRHRRQHQHRQGPAQHQHQQAGTGELHLQTLRHLLGQQPHPGQQRHGRQRRCQQGTAQHAPWPQPRGHQHTGQRHQQVQGRPHGQRVSRHPSPACLTSVNPCRAAWACPSYRPCVSSSSSGRRPSSSSSCPASARIP